MVGEDEFGVCIKLLGGRGGRLTLLFNSSPQAHVGWLVLRSSGSGVLPGLPPRLNGASRVAALVHVLLEGDPAASRRKMPRVLMRHIS